MTPDTLHRAVGDLAADRRSGASEILPRAVAILRAAAAEGPERLSWAASAVCAAQPSMAPVLNASAAALHTRVDTGALDRFEQRWRRAGAALRRVAVEALGPAGGEALHVTTCSYSASVAGVLADLGRRTRLTVACAEGRPLLEGRRLAEDLARAGVAVEFFTDAGLGEALARTDVVVVGADAVTPRWFLNKCGTRAIAAQAGSLGRPVYVAATRDKFLSDARAEQLSVAAHDAAEVWDAAPPGVVVHNPYFERVPLDLLTGVITDAGVLGTGMVGEACGGGE